VFSGEMGLPMNDTELVQRFARDGSPAAFRELVARHTNFVYSCAVQRLHDAHAAQDVTQAVFLALALKAKGLSPDTPLPGWLYQATRYACAKHQRGEQRRKEREMHASEQLSASADSPAPWTEIEPHLAAALDALPDKDREAVFTRFYRQGSYRDVATALRTTEDSARKRVDRALERMRAFFTKKGVVLSVTGLAGLLTANAVQAAPAGLAVTCAGLAAGSALASTPTLMLAKGALHAMFIAKLKAVSLAAAACLVVAGTGVVIAKQVTESHPAAPAAVTLPATEPVQLAEANPAPVAPPNKQESTPADYKPVSLRRGVVVGMRSNAGRWSCRVALEKPFNNLTEIDVYCCNPPAIILLDGKPTTFAEAVAPLRHIEFDHVRGATPYISVSADATKRSPLTWVEIIQKADAAAPGLFVDRKPTGATRDIRINLKNGQYLVSTINSLAVNGKRQETGRARLTLDAGGNLLGQVETDWSGENAGVE
jgi:RNA polymerase sigma factor (sigma-70 family)